MPIGREPVAGTGPIGSPWLGSLDGRGYRNLGRVSRIDRWMYVVIKHRVARHAGRLHPACTSKEGITRAETRAHPRTGTVNTVQLSTPTSILSEKPSGRTYGQSAGGTPSNPSIRGAGSPGRVMPRTVCEAASDRKFVGDSFSGAPASCHWPPSAYIPAGKEAAMTRELRGC